MDNDIHSIKKAIEGIETLKNQMYQICFNDISDVINHNIQDKKRIELIFDHLLDFYFDEEVMSLFWQLINYVETFDQEMVKDYRKIAQELIEDN